MMNDKELDLKVRTRKFAVRIIRLYKALPNSVEAQIIGKQILRSDLLGRNTAKQLAPAQMTNLSVRLKVLLRN